MPDAMKQVVNSSMALALDVSLAQLSVILDEDTVEYYIRVQGTFSLRWRDPRLADATTNPCKA
eukprot:1389817-Prymnesium_polylepis.2